MQQVQGQLVPQNTSLKINSTAHQMNDNNRNVCSPSPGGKKLDVKVLLSKALREKAPFHLQLQVVLGVL